MAKCISIIGSSASGKSSVGPLLAAKLNLPILDIDKVVAERVGKNVDKIFAEEGTEYFQNKNWEVLSEIFTTRNDSFSLLIIGASPIQNKDIRTLIKLNSSFIIGLYARPKVLVKRISDSLSVEKHAAHLLLIFEDNFYFSEMLFEFREPFSYFADEIIDTSELTQRQVCDVAEEITLNFLNNQKNSHVRL